MALTSNEEFYRRYSGRYFGPFRGIVTAIESEDDTNGNKFFRIKAIVPVVLGPDEETGWCWPKGGGNKTGFIWPPEISDFVWVEFEEGDPQRPIWSHGPWGRMNDESMVPLHALGEEDDIDSLIRDTGILPASSFAGKYPHVRIIQSPTKHFLEFDDTEDATRVQLAHKEGTRIEMTHDGSMEIVTKGELREYVSEAFKLEVMDKLEALVHDAISMESEQDISLKSAGGEVTLNTSSAPGVSLGGASATEPFVMGNQWQTLMTNILTTLSTHIHPAPGTSPPATAANILAHIPELVSSLSTYIKGK